ncbi:MAG TPA: hypothetical protein PKL29_06995 [Methanothrix sp.]|nr:hypothetical protein [Methanothrix sp.]
MTAGNISIITQDFLGHCLLTRAQESQASTYPGISCSCQEMQPSNFTDYLDPMDARLQWGEGCTEDGLCPLCCSALGEAIASVQR